MQDVWHLDNFLLDRGRDILTTMLEAVFDTETDPV
jgi:hypothetical protein